MATVVADKYHLRTIHEEIDLFDRKLAHLTAHEAFPTEAARDAATRKLTLKRDNLVKTAKRLVSEGVEFKPSELPRSLRPKDLPAEPVEKAATEQSEPQEAEPKAAAVKPQQQAQPSPFAGTSLDWQSSIERYMLDKKKA